MEEKLRFVKPGLIGYARIKKGKEFEYRSADGALISDHDILQRIRSLVLPPAWEEVWICPWPNGHLQATGKDTLGRKQYRYHTVWTKTRGQHKFDRMRTFGEKLPLIRARMRRDLHRQTLDKSKVTAIALRTMEETLIRVGNASYEKLYGSYGLTTLHNKHVTIQGNKAFFRFKGKKGVLHKIELKEASLIKLLQKVREIPGQELFQYYDENGDHRSLDSGEINEYLKESSGDEFTAKDFRTWAGSVHTLQLMAGFEPFDSVAECKRQLVEVIGGVACRLGNTATVCKKYYIHPLLLETYQDGRLQPFLQRVRAIPSHPPKGPGLHSAEKVFLSFLQKV
jgi:DNA topoisomerase I